LNTGASPDFNEKHSLGLRLWHWTFFILITGTIITVLLASTLFRTRNNITLVQQQLQEKNLSVSQDQARAVAHALNDKLWDLHTWIGYFIALFLLGRFVLEVLQPADEKLGPKIRKAMGFKPLSVEQKKGRQHYLRVKAGYLIFYGLILVMAITGIGLAFEEVPLLRTLHNALKQIHSFTQYLIYGYILLHLGGVVLADAGSYPGLVSGMIHGKKRF
jgi:cytochrome b561